MSALFFGEPNALKLAYPSSIRTEVSKHLKVHPEALTSQNWSHCSPEAQETEIILGTWGMPLMDEHFLAHFPKLRAIFYAAGSVKGFVTDELYNRGIVVCSAANANAVPVAEYTLATTLLSLKRFWTFARNMQGGMKRQVDSCTGTYHATVGLVSLGAVGRSVAQMLSRFDLDIIAYDPFLPKELADELGVEMVSLEDLFRRSDVVSLHSPWLPETEGLINEKLLSLMKVNATFINTSRGAIVNEPDLCKVMAERPDLTSILDVTWPEPPATNSPLYSLPNVMLTPHIAGSMGNEITRMGDWMVAEMNRFLTNAPLHYQITPEMLARMA